MENYSRLTDAFSWLKDYIEILYDKKTCLTILCSTDRPILDDILLSDHETRKAQNFRCPIHSKRYIIGRKLLRFLLNLEACKTPFLITQSGKPYIKHGIGFSVSYSEGYIALSLAPTQIIGVDLECSPQDSPCIDIPQNVFHDDELRWIYKNNIRSLNENFLTCWTRKEAVVKADGTGLNENTKNINTYPDSKNGCSIPHQSYRLWTFYSKKNNVIISVAVENDIKSVLYLDCNYLSKP